MRYDSGHAERGAINSNVLIVAAGIALALGVYMLGYYSGSHQAVPQAISADGLKPLPDMGAKDMPKPEDYTFYKTLTDKENKTVSIDLKARSDVTPSVPTPPSAAVKPPEVAPEVPAPTQKATVVEPAPAQKKEIPLEKASVTHNEQKTVADEKPKSAADKHVVATKDKEKKQTAEKDATPKARFALQISSHQEKHVAEGEVKKLKKKGFSAVVSATTVPKKGTWYRVRINGFATRQAAERVRKEIKSKVHLSSIVVAE